MSARVILLALTFAAPVLAAPPLRPDAKLTPGVTLAVTAAQVCKRGYATSVRHVPESEKRAVFKAYGIASPKPGTFEVDHLISLEIGGSNDIKNLWPQSYVTKPWNAHVKDKLENHLHALVCAGKVPLPTAQHAIAHDWIAAYRQYIGAQP